MRVRVCATVSLLATLAFVPNSIPVRAMPQWADYYLHYDSSGNQIGGSYSTCELINGTYSGEWGDQSSQIRSMQLGPECDPEFTVPSCSYMGAVATACTNYCVTASYRDLVYNSVISDACVI
jgi:hypothetical protein